MVARLIRSILVLSVIALFVGTTVGCSTDEKATEGAAPDASGSMERVNRSVQFSSTGVERDGWSWLEDSVQTARWEYRDFPVSLTDLVVDVRALVSSSPSSSGGGRSVPVRTAAATATFSVTYGQGGETLGTQAIERPITSSNRDLNGAHLVDEFVIPLSTLPEGLSSLWITAATVAGQQLGVRADSLQFAPLRLARALGSPVSTPRPPPGGSTTKPPTTAPPTTAPPTTASSFTSNGDAIQGWYWLRDAAGTDSGRWTFPTVPARDFHLAFSVLATDRAGGGRDVDAQFYVTYGNIVGDQARPSVVAPVMVTAANVAPPDDPVGYACAGGLDVPRSTLSRDATGMWVQVNRVGGSGPAPLPAHVAVRADSVTLVDGPAPSTTTTTSSTTTSTTVVPSTTTTIEPLTAGGSDALRPGADTDITHDADSAADADRVGLLEPGTYQGTLGTDDTSDWFAFRLEETQVASIDVYPAAGLQASSDLIDPTFTPRAPADTEPSRLHYRHVAGLGAGGRWYLSIARLAGAGAYTFTVGVADQNDALHGGDAGNDVARATPVGAGALPGLLLRDDPADAYSISLAASQVLTATLESLSGENFALELRDGTQSIDQRQTGSGTPGPNTTTTIEAPASSGSRQLTAVITRVGGRGGDYRLTLTRSNNGQCATTLVNASSFSSTGALLVQPAPGTQPSEWWLQGDASRPQDQTATWIFSTASRDEFRFIVDVLLSGPDGQAVGPAAVYFRYGVIPAPDSSVVAGTELVNIQADGGTGTADVRLPNSALGSAGAAYWVQMSLADPGDRVPLTATDVGVSAGSVKLCVAPGSVRQLAGPGPTPSVQLSYDGASHILGSDRSIFTDPATDIDGDTLNQNWENAAAEIANPTLELDEEEWWLDHRDQGVANFVQVDLWPSATDPQYVIFGYLNTWSYDAGGAQFFQKHRGDSERIWEAWRILDDRTVRLEWVYTSAHDINDHAGVWHVSDRQCNLAVIAATTGAETWAGLTEVMCDNLQFDGAGMLVLYSSENKHALYPSAQLCERVTLVTTAFYVPLFGEDCGWNPFGDESTISGDHRYEGNGRWRFDVYNVGEPSHHLIDDLDEPTQWRGLTAVQVTRLTGLFPKEAVWSGRDGSPNDFCGGLDAGGDYPDECSGPLGQKFANPLARLTKALSSAYRLELQTGDELFAGTDEAVRVELLDGAGVVLADRWYVGDLERGDTDVAYVERQSSGDVAKVRVERTNNQSLLTADWYLHAVAVSDLAAGTGATWTFDDWITADEQVTRP